MSILILAEHDGAALKPATLATITAAIQLQQPIHLLVLGNKPDGAATQAGTIKGVEKVLVGDDAQFDKPLAEIFAAAVLEVADDYNYILAPATTFGKYKVNDGFAMTATSN